MRKTLIAIVLFCCGFLKASPQNWHNLMKLPPFERAVTLTKFYEQWHTRKDYPYIGYGHRIQPNEKLTYPITEHQADSISYDCGCTSLLGKKTQPKSTLLKKLDANNRNILCDLLEICHYKGKRLPHIQRRRWVKYHLLYYQ